MQRVAPLLILPAAAVAQLAGASVKEVHPPLPLQACDSTGACTTEQTKVTLDANWRWLHNKGGYTNCYTGTEWDATLCPDPQTCAANCALEGVDYAKVYEVTTSGSELQLGYVAPGGNVGSRTYLMDAEDDTKYRMFKLKNRDFSFTIDVSQEPCGLNGALYFVQMDADGGMARFPSNKAGAAYGTGYCDAQCPNDVKFINGEANILDWDTQSASGRFGSCCTEMDIWEGNVISNALTPHPCSVDGQTQCGKGTDVPCGHGETSRYTGSCDMDGCDFNPWRVGNRTFYGPGSDFTIDTTQPFQVSTSFITADNTVFDPKL